MRYQLGIVGLTAVFLTGGANGMNEQQDDAPKRAKSLQTTSHNHLKAEASSPATKKNVRSVKSLSLKRLSVCNNLPEAPAEMPDGDASDILTIVPGSQVQVDESLAQSVPLSEGESSSTAKPPLDKSQERKILKVTPVASPTLTRLNTNPTIARLNLSLTDLRTSPPRDHVYSARGLGSPKLDPDFLRSEAQKEFAKIVPVEDVTTVAAPAVAPVSQESSACATTLDDGTASDDSSSS